MCCDVSVFLSVWAGLMEVKDVGSLMTDLLMSCSFSSLIVSLHFVHSLCLLSLQWFYFNFVRDQDHSLQRHFSHQTFDMQESIRWSYSLFSFQIIHIFLHKSQCAAFSLSLCQSAACCRCYIRLHVFICIYRWDRDVIRPFHKLNS